MKTYIPESCLTMSDGVLREHEISELQQVWLFFWEMQSAFETKRKDSFGVVCLFCHRCQTTPTQTK